MVDTSRPATFELKDSSGNTHTYETTYHPADEGFEISVELIGLLGEPFMRALGGIEEVVQNVASGDADGMGGIDLAGAMATLRTLDPKSVYALAKRVLKHTTRGGGTLVGHAFTKAYQANYTELYMALWKVIEANQFVPLLDTLSESLAQEAEVVDIASA